MIPITGDSLGMRLVPLVHLSLYDMQTRNDVCACLLEQVFSCVFLMYTHAHTHTHTHTHNSQSTYMYQFYASSASRVAIIDLRLLSTP